MYFCKPKKESSKIKMIKYNHLLIFVFICLLFTGCKKNNEPTQNNTAIIKPNQLILPENMVLSRIDIKDTIYKYVVHISYPTVLQKKDTLNLKPTYQVWSKELNSFVDSLTVLYNRKLNKDTSYLSFELTETNRKQEHIYLLFDKKLYLTTNKDTLKEKVSVNYNAKTGNLEVKTSKK